MKYYFLGARTLNISESELTGCRLVCDTSVAINILGTGMSIKILRSIPCDVIIVRHAYGELKRHPLPDCDLDDELKTWSTRSLVRVVTLTNNMISTLDELTRGGFGASFGSGEAATMAYVIGSDDNSIPVIDEKKATNFFREQWHDRRILNTLVVFRFLKESGRLRSGEIRTAVLSALQHARMQVPRNSRQWVIDLLGPEEAAKCGALKRHLRFG